MVIYLQVRFIKNPNMSPKQRKEYRRLRLIELIDTHFNKNQAIFADKAQIAANLVSRYVNGLKGIGEDMRDKIERNTGFLGWLDRPLSEDPATGAVTPVLTTRQQTMVALFDGLTQSQQDEEIRRLETQKQSNDAIVGELLSKRRA